MTMHVIVCTFRLNYCVFSYALRRSSGTVFPFSLIRRLRACIREKSTGCIISRDQLLHQIFITSLRFNDILDVTFNKTNTSERLILIQRLSQYSCSRRMLLLEKKVVEFDGCRLLVAKFGQIYAWKNSISKCLELSTWNPVQIQIKSR